MGMGTGNGRERRCRVLVGLAGMLAGLGVAGWILTHPPVREAAYLQVAAWGTKGSEPGAFADPTGIAVADGEVFVADARNSRIQVFAEDGRFLRAFGGSGEGFGALGRPMNLEIRNGRIYVADYDRDRVIAFTLDGAPVAEYGAETGAGALDSPSGVAVTEDGRVHVVDFYGGHLTVFAPDGAAVLADAGKSFIYPSDVAVLPDGGRVLAEGYAHRLHLYDPSGAPAGRFGGLFGLRLPGAPFRGWFKTVSSVAVDGAGAILATDFYNGRVQKFDPSGRFLTSFGEGLLDKPFGIAVAASGHVFVVDNAAHRITVWRPPG